MIDAFFNGRIHFVFRFSGLFGSGGSAKEAPLPPPRRSATTSFQSTTVKKSPTNDQIAPITSTKQENPTNETLPLDRSIADRFDFLLYSFSYQ